MARTRRQNTKHRSIVRPGPVERLLGSADAWSSPWITPSFVRQKGVSIAGSK